MKTVVYVLNKTGEVYQNFSDTESAIRWLSRTGYLQHRTVIIQKGTSAKVWETVESLTDLQKEMNDFLFPRP